jgi:Transposase IS66 family
MAWSACVRVGQAARAEPPAPVPPEALRRPAPVPEQRSASAAQSWLARPAPWPSVPSRSVAREPALGTLHQSRRRDRRRDRRGWSRSAARRDFEFLAEGRGSDKDLGQADLAVCEELFWTWEIYQHTANRQELKRRVRVLQRQLKAVLREHAAKHARYRQSRRFARAMLKIWPGLWTFANRPGVQPTNNHAERCLRGAVIYRKLSLGSQSKHGEQRIARLLSAHTTTRLQKRSLHAYLIDVLTARATRHPVPLLA